MRRAAALAALTLALLPLGCTHASGTSSDELVIAQTSEFPSLNPIYLEGYEGAEIADLLYSSLLGFDARGDLVPQLASVVPTLANGGIARDGKTLTYHLRRDARWSDGVPITVRDVFFTHRAQMDPRNAAPETYGDSEIASLERIDDYDFRVHLKRAYAPFVSLFVRPILPEHILEKSGNLQTDPFDAAPVGSGPYKLAEWKRGDHMTFDADPNAWLGAPHIAHVRIEFLPDPNTIELQMRSGEADLAPIFDPAHGRIADTSRDRIVSYASRSFTLLILNHDVPLLDDAVRRALALGIDRARIMKNATANTYDPGTPFRGLLGWAYDPSDPPPAYDPARARALLDADGWHVGPGGIRTKGGRALRLGIATLASYPAFVNVVEQVQQDSKALGIAFDVKTYEEKTAVLLLRGMTHGTSFDTFYLSLQTDYDPDPSAFFGCVDGKPVAYNFSHLCDPRLDALMAQGSASFDPAARKRIYAAVQRRMQETLPVIMFAQSESFSVVSRRVGGYDPIPVGGPFWNVASWTLDS